MFLRLAQSAALTALVLVPTEAQFGIAGMRNKASNFQDLHEMAKKQQQEQAGAPSAGGAAGLGSLEDLMAGLGGADMQKAMEEMMNDPEMKKYYEQLGSQFGSAMDELSKMSPEELEKQMKDAFSMLTDGSMVDQVVQSRDEVIKQLEVSGTVPPEELARMKTDPAYFELKMRESFDQMKGMFDDPEMMKTMTDTMQGMKELFDSGTELGEALEKLLKSDELTDPTKIEEARLQLLSGDFADNPLLNEMLGTEEMQELLKDPKKFRENIMGGQNLAGAGIGEL